MPNWSEICPHPSLVLIIGDVGTGKTATMCNLMEYYHNEGQNIYLVANKDIVENYPKWVQRMDRDNVKSLPGAIFMDDVHLLLYAREHQRRRHKAFDFMGRQRRHTDTSIVATTQQGAVLDINIVRMVDCVIIKRPSLLQKEMERPEIKRLIKEADKQLEGKDFKYAYVYSGKFKGLIGPYGTPSWFSDEISFSRVSEKPVRAYNERRDIIMSIADAIRGLSGHV